MSPITQGLIITGIGMGLVFVAILFLWGLMTLLVRLTADRPEVIKPEEPAEAETVETAVVEETSVDDKRYQQAAAAAVAVALQLARRSSQAQPQESSGISPWQATRRATFLSRNANLGKRK